MLFGYQAWLEHSQHYVTDRLYSLTFSDGLFQLEVGLLQRRTLLDASPQDIVAAVDQV